jgi:hypothetical protein
MSVLDDKRLGKQRVEAAQILRILTGQRLFVTQPTGQASNAWQNHPAVLMWRGHDHWLRAYIAASIREWRARGFNNTILTPEFCLSAQAPPAWLGLRRFHVSHQANLVRKLPAVYGKLWPTVDPTLPYWWPSKEVPR